MCIEFGGVLLPMDRTYSALHGGIRRKQRRIRTLVIQMKREKEFLIPIPLFTLFLCVGKGFFATFAPFASFAVKIGLLLQANYYCIPVSFFGQHFFPSRIWVRQCCVAMNAGRQLEPGLPSWDLHGDYAILQSCFAGTFGGHHVSPAQPQQ